MIWRFIAKIRGPLLNLSIKNEPLERLFFSEKNIIFSLCILIASCICGAIYPFLEFNSGLNFSTSEFIIKFVGLLSQNLFIISGLYFLGITLFATPIRAGLKNSKGESPDSINILTFRKHINLLSLIQIPVLIGMISIAPIIREQKTLSDIIIFISTIWLYTLIIRSVFVLYGFNLQVKESLYLRYVKSFLIVIFTYIPSTMIFQLFIVGLIKGVVEIWI
ncbi:MAG: hypothetical protein VX590_00885 [Chloroflexota bacterium]|nr:hypothetical protein [Chloroflexota bacterium]|tara:strand:+ start:1048 stop:1707 length:660 start_codon:yes stop_codon:yes gene_type:complete